MLNFTSGAADLNSAIRTAQVKRVVTAHRFIELGKLEDAAQAARRKCEIVYLEDVRAKLSLRDKLTAVGGQFAPGLLARTAPYDKAGGRSCSPPAPRASPRAWRSAIPTCWPMSSRCARISISIDSDVLFNPLPTFHCFGLTVGIAAAADRRA